jgi:hypothetical protein
VAAGAILGFLEQPERGSWVAGVGRDQASRSQRPRGQVGRVGIVGGVYGHLEVGQGLALVAQVER